MSALDDLIAAVDGAIDAPDDGVYEFATSEHAKLAQLAYHGSLDAALRLHEALLPGWEWMFYYDGECGVQHPETTDFCISKIAVGKYAPAARAWLLAILRALKAKEAGNE